VFLVFSEPILPGVPPGFGGLLGLAFFVLSHRPVSNRMRFPPFVGGALWGAVSGPCPRVGAAAPLRFFFFSFSSVAASLVLLAFFLGDKLGRPFSPAEPPSNSVDMSQRLGGNVLVRHIFLAVLSPTH